MLEVIMFAFQDYDNTVQTIHVFNCVQYIIVYVLYIIYTGIYIYTCIGFLQMCGIELWHVSIHACLVACGSLPALVCWAVVRSVIGGKGKKGHPHLLKTKWCSSSQSCKRHTKQKVSGVLLPNFLWREGRSYDIHTLSAGASLVVSGQWENSSWFQNRNHMSWLSPKYTCLGSNGNSQGIASDWSSKQSCTHH